MIQPGVGGRRAGLARRHRRRVPLLLIVVCSQFVVSSSAAPASDGCYRVAFQSAPVWSSSLTWRPQGWLLVDPGSGEIRLFSATGEDEGPRIRPGQGPFEFSRPGDLALIDDGLLLHDDDTHWLWLNEALEPKRQLDFDESPTKEGDVLGAPFGWAATAGGHVFAYLHVYQSDATWWTGLAEITLSDPPRYQRLIDLDRFAPAAVYHTLILQTVATIGDSGYFLQDEDPVILLEAPSLRRLTGAVPEALRHPPSLPPLRAETVGPFFAQMERQRRAVGIYSHDGRLFLLERDPTGGTVRWTLHEIDPVADRIVRSRVLPTEADWIVPAPGPETWAFLEKGPVKGILEQKHRGLLFVPTAWIEGDRSPLEGSAPPACIDGHPPAPAKPASRTAAAPSPPAEPLPSGGLR